MPNIAYVVGFLPFFDPLHTIKTFSAKCPQDFLQDCPQHFLQEFPVTFSRKNFPQHFPARFSRKIFPQDFPTRFSRKNFPQHLLIIKGPSCPHHPFPKSYGNPKSMNKLTLNKPAIIFRRISHKKCIFETNS